MFTTERTRRVAKLSIVTLFVSLCVPTVSAAEGRFTPGLRGLIDQDRDRSAEEWRTVLAGLCTATIRAGSDGKPIVFRARPVSELLVHYDSNFDGLRGRLATGVTFDNRNLDYLVFRIPDDDFQSFFEEDAGELLQTSGVRLVGPRCLPLQSAAADEDAEPCVKPEKLAHEVLPVTKIRDAAECGDQTLDKNRNAIGLPELLGDTAGKTTLVAVIDVGFDLFDTLGTALGEATYKVDGSAEKYVNGWDYCENDKGIFGARHGTQMSGLVAASCGDFSTAPGIAQSSLIFGMQVFYKTDQGHNGFSSPEALAMAIDHAHAMGARVVNMSFTIDPDHEYEWTPVKTAIEKADNVVFVTGPWTNSESPFPSELQSGNVMFVGTRFWSAGDLVKKTWGSDLQIDAPWAAKLVIDPNSSGASNAIAMVSGAAAELLGRCESLPPEKVRDILVGAGLPSSDSLAKPLLQVGFLKNYACPEQCGSP